MRFALLAVPLFLAACPEVDPSVVSEVVLAEDCSNADSSGVTVEGLAIDGDTLTATLSFGGGCEDHGFNLCWDQVMLESDPPQTTLYIDHVLGADDSCEALLTESHTFDLSALRDDGQGGPMQGGTIVLTVGDVSLDYTF